MFNSPTPLTVHCRSLPGPLPFVAMVLSVLGARASWDEWWTYDGISGPDYWGLLNPEWRLCNKGRRQSPVDIDPSHLLFDPHLGPIVIDKHRVNGSLSNTGHSVVFRVNNSPPLVYIRGGPLSYRYRFYEIQIHYGREDDRGSEHTVAGRHFAAELQLVGYNSQLYRNVSEASDKTQGLVIISLLVKVGESSSVELQLITSQLNRIVYKGEEIQVVDLSIRELLPDNSVYITYEGSTTMPECQESVTWVIINKPLYVTKDQLQLLRTLMQGDRSNPKAVLADNFRPPQPLYSRPVRTNVGNPHMSEACSPMKNVIYRANTKKPDT